MIVAVEWKIWIHERSNLIFNAQFSPRVYMNARSIRWVGPVERMGDKFLEHIVNPEGNRSLKGQY
jgi:hypothetical protein